MCSHSDGRIPSIRSLMMLEYEHGVRTEAKCLGDDEWTFTPRAHDVTTGPSSQRLCSLPAANGTEASKSLNQLRERVLQKRKLPGKRMPKQLVGASIAVSITQGSSMVESTLRADQSLIRLPAVSTRGGKMRCFPAWQGALSSKLLPARDLVSILIFGAIARIERFDPLLLTPTLT